MDIVLDHPTSSRLHAVIQFRAEDGAPFLFDPGSTHGTFLNKHRLEEGQYVALRCAGAARRLWVGGIEGVTPLWPLLFPALLVGKRLPQMGDLCQVLLLRPYPFSIM